MQSEAANEGRGSPIRMDPEGKDKLFKRTPIRFCSIGMPHLVSQERSSHLVGLGDVLSDGNGVAQLLCQGGLDLWHLALAHLTQLEGKLHRPRRCITLDCRYSHSPGKNRTSTTVTEAMPPLSGACTPSAP